MHCINIDYTIHILIHSLNLLSSLGSSEKCLVLRKVHQFHSRIVERSPAVRSVGFRMAYLAAHSNENQCTRRKASLLLREKMMTFCIWVCTIIIRGEFNFSLRPTCPFQHILCTNSNEFVKRPPKHYTPPPKKILHVMLNIDVTGI